MFVYEFMSGLAGTISGEPETDDEAAGIDEGATDYDPHKHRVIAKPTSYSETMIHLLKGSIGAGVLAMPDAIRRLGIIYGVVGFVLIGFFATYTIQLLIAVQYKLCKRWRRGYMAYPKSMRLILNEGPKCCRSLAPVLARFVDTVLLMWQLGICCIYFVFVAENIKQVCDYHGAVISLRLHLCYVLIPTIILNLVKDLKLMTPLSSISNVVTFIGLILVFFYLVEDDIALEKEMLQLKNIMGIPIFIGTALFALEAVGVVLALEYNMEDPKQFVGMCGLFNIGMVIITALYILVGVFGYLKYGDEMKPSITLNLPQDQKKAQAAKLTFALAIFLTFPLQNFVAYNILWGRLRKHLAGRSTLVPDYLLRVVLVIIPWLLAVAVPQLGPFIALFGALCLSLLAIVFPSVMDVCWLYNQPAGYGVCRYKLFRDVAIIVIGMAFLISGVYTSVLEIIHSN